MDITQTTTLVAQPDVGLKLVKDGSNRSSNDRVSAKVVQAKVMEESTQTNPKDLNADAKALKESKTQTAEKLAQQVSQMNEYVQSIQRDLSFSVDEGSGKTVVKVFNTHTKELVRQIPTEEMLEIAERIKESNESKANTPSGLIFKVEV